MFNMTFDHTLAYDDSSFPSRSIEKKLSCLKMDDSSSVCETACSSSVPSIGAGAFASSPTPNYYGVPDYMSIGASTLSSSDSLAEEGVEAYVTPTSPTSTMDVRLVVLNRTKKPPLEQPSFDCDSLGPSSVVCREDYINACKIRPDSLTDDEMSIDMDWSDDEHEEHHEELVGLTFLDSESRGAQTTRSTSCKAT